MMDLPAFKQFLHDKHFRFTPQRMAVLRAIDRNGGRHPSALDIYIDVKAELPGIGISTVYNTLRLLEREGMLCRVAELNKTSFYAVAGSPPAVCRMVCTQCGRVTEIQESGVHQAVELLQRSSRFQIKQGTMDFCGICDSCTRANATPAESQAVENQAARAI